MVKGVLVSGRDQNHRPTIAAITAVGASARHVFLASKGGAAVATTTTTNDKIDLVEEHRDLKTVKGNTAREET